MDEIPHLNEQGIEHWNVRKFGGSLRDVLMKNKDIQIIKLNYNCLINSFALSKVNAPSTDALSKIMK